MTITFFLASISLNDNQKRANFTYIFELNFWGFACEINHNFHDKIYSKQLGNLQILDLDLYLNSLIFPLKSRKSSTDLPNS